MRTIRYQVVDVFTDVPLRGNPLAVFPDAELIAEDELQAVAREMNLSETTFVYAPVRGGTARVRIFTPASELPFAGHPTIGTAFVLARLGRSADDAVLLEEGIGDVPVRIERREPFLAWLSTPPIRFETCFAGDAVVRALGLEPDDRDGRAPVQRLGAGNAFLYVPLRDRAAVDRAALDLRSLLAVASDIGVTGVFVFTATDGDVYARMFARQAGVVEDPATGSATGPLGAYLAAYGFIPAEDGTTFTSEQGTAMGRRSILHGRLRYDGASLRTVEVGGGVTPFAEGTVTLP
jgi:trans-2,3-dihydro-3-hydroxyanthranilate isomerase